MHSGAVIPAKAAPHRCVRVLLRTTCTNVGSALQPTFVSIDVFLPRSNATVLRPLMMREASFECGGSNPLHGIAIAALAVTCAVAHDDCALHVLLFYCADRVRLSSGASGMPTAGGVAVTITGSWLGLNSSAVSMVYTGGLAGQAQHTYTSHDCTVLRAGAEVACMAVAGVGGKYSFQLLVDGGRSEPSVDTLSYAPPTITGLLGPGAVESSSQVSNGVPQLRGNRA
jgi:hypothetical protein